MTRTSATETICAVSTPPGFGGIGVIRVSGARSRIVASSLLGRLPPPRKAVYCNFSDSSGKVIDDGLALWFPGPKSFTGEDVLELQGHGGPVVLQMLMKRLIELGCRAALPGEFSERAFLNDKLDLAQAEAIADLITSGTAEAARAAHRSLAGEFSDRVHALQAQVSNLRVFVEASIDFPDEEIDFLAESDVEERLEGIRRSLMTILEQATIGRLLHDGITLAIIGRPNAGKSSVLNALAGEDSAIVSETPGTTRDVLREVIDVGGLPVHVADTAGIRETADEIEQEGVKRARRAQHEADMSLLIVDASKADEAPLALLGHSGARDQTIIVVLNKSDLPPRITADEIKAHGAGQLAGIVQISALHGDGLESLRTLIRESTGLSRWRGGTFSARQRHVDALRRLLEHVEAGGRQIKAGHGELLAEELRLGQQALGEITGEVLPDDLLGQIFASFCIGK